MTDTDELRRLDRRIVELRAACSSLELELACVATDANEAVALLREVKKRARDQFSLRFVMGDISRFLSRIDSRT